MLDEELRMLHKLFLELGLTATLAALLFGVYFFVAHKRAKKIPISFFALFVSILALYILIILDDSDVPFLQTIHLWKSVSQWIRFTAYLGTAFFLMKAADLLFVEDFLIGKKGLYIPELLRLLFLAAGVAIAALIFLRTVMGINVIALVAIPTALTAVIGFALQDTIKRFFAGLTLGRLLRVGDWVHVAGREGRVTHVDLSHLTIITREDDLVMIPNDVALQQNILNYNQPTTKHGRSVVVDAAYAAPPLEVERILVDAAKAVPGVLSDPPPQVFTSAFKDSSIQYRVKYWIDEYVRALEIDGHVLSYAWYAFRRHGIEMPFPQRVIHTMKDEEPSQIAQREQARIRGALKHIDFLSVLSPEELGGLAEKATTRVYLPGEVIVHQGEEGSELFFILDGHAEVRVGEGPDSVLATLNPSQFFGEMSLLTGERRSASIVAQTRLEVLVLNKEAIAGPLRSNPSLVGQMSTLLVKRKSELAAHQERMSRRSDGDKEVEEHSLGARIRKFFGL